GVAARRPGFHGPAGIAVDPRGPLYVADAGAGRILRLWGDGTFLSELGGGAALGGAQLSGAGAVAVAPASGLLYVADSGHNRVLSFSPEGSLLASWGALAGSGSPGSGPGEFRGPAAVAVDGAGNVYVADKGNDRIVAIAVNCAGNVYVADTNNNRVERFDGAARSPTRCVPAGDWPRPLDVAPVLRVGLARRLGVLARRALALTVSCRRGCRILARATL